MSIFYGNNSFFPSGDRLHYEDAKLWPANGFEISESEWLNLLAGQTQGKIIAPGSDGRPTLLNQEMVEPKPSSCTRKQGNMALYEMGYLDEVQAIVAAAPENVRIAYNDAATFERTDPFLQMMASDIGLTNEQLDQLFALAVTL